MVCLWCKDGELASDLVKALASPETPSACIEKALPDLFLCLDCVHAYHKQKTKIEWTTIEKEDLLSIEHERVTHHLNEVYKEVKHVNCKSTFNNDMLNNVQQPLLEVLIYPYLLLREEILELTTLVLEKLIQLDRYILKIDYRCSGIYLLLVSPSEKIRLWCSEMIARLHVVEMSDLHFIKPVVNALLNIFLLEEIDEQENMAMDYNEITDSTTLPTHLYQDVKKKDLWFAYCTIFKSLQGRILKMVLVEGKNKKFLSMMINELHADNIFWIILDALCCLLEKLGPKFWLMLSNIARPADLFLKIIKHPSFTTKQEEIGLSEYMSTNVEKSAESFLWIMSFFKSLFGFEKVYLDTLNQIFLFFIETLDNCIKTSILFQHAADCFLGILNYIFNINCISVVNDYAQKFSEVLLFLAKAEDTKTAVVESALSLINLIVKHSSDLKLLSKSQHILFKTNFQRMQVNQSHDDNIITSTISYILKNQVDLEEELDVVNVELLKSVKDSLKCGKEVYQYEISNTCTTSSEKTRIEQRELDTVKFYGYESPEEISDNESDDHCILSDETSQFTYEYIHHIEDTKHEIVRTKFEIKGEDVNQEKSINTTNEDVEINRTPELIKFEQCCSDLRKQLKNGDDDYDDKQKVDMKTRSILKLSSNHFKTETDYFDKSLSNCDKQSFKNSSIVMLQNLILSWKTSWLTATNKCGSIFDLDLLKPIQSSSFESYDSYVDTFCPLILLETWMSLGQKWQSSEEKYVTYMLDYVEKDQQNKDLNCTKCYHENNQNDEHLKTNDLVVMKFNVNNSEYKIYGIITNTQQVFTKSKKATLFSVWLKSTTYTFLKTHHVSLACVGSLTSLIQQWNALLNLKNSLLLNDILKPFSLSTYSLKDLHGAKREGTLSKLNRNQVKAVSSITSDVLANTADRRITLIQGAPGTGKTYTLKSIIIHLLQVLKKNSLKQDDRDETLLKRPRLLVCGPTNSSVDESMKRVLSSLSKPNQTGNSFNMVRVGDYQKVGDKLQEFTLERLLSKEMKMSSSHHQNEAVVNKLQTISRLLEKLDETCLKLKFLGKTKEYNKLSQERSSLQNNFDDLSKKYASLFDHHVEKLNLERSILLKADVVFCTMEDAGSKCMMRTFKDNICASFGCLLVDDANQCVEPLSLVPLQYGITKMVMFGDVARIPVRVHSRKVAQCCLGQSLFTRLTSSLKQNKVPHSVTTLTVQYRLLPDILSFPSMRFFQNNLEPKKEIILRNVVHPLKNYAVLNIMSSFKDKSIRSHNIRSQCIAVCHSLIHAHIKLNEICIVVPHLDEERLLRSEMKKHSPVESVHVCCVEALGGREWDVVIVLYTQVANSDDNNGLLHPLGISIALTRAKKSLLVIGDTSVGIENSHWQTLLKDAKSRCHLHNVTSFRDLIVTIFSHKWKQQNKREMEAIHASLNHLLELPLKESSLKNNSNGKSMLSEKKKMADDFRLKSGVNDKSNNHENMDNEENIDNNDYDEDTGINKLTATEISVSLLSFYDTQLPVEIEGKMPRDDVAKQPVVVSQDYEMISEGELSDSNGEDKERSKNKTDNGLRDASKIETMIPIDRPQQINKTIMRNSFDAISSVNFAREKENRSSNPSEQRIYESVSDCETDEADFENNNNNKNNKDDDKDGNISDISDVITVTSRDQKPLPVLHITGIKGDTCRIVNQSELTKEVADVDTQTIPATPSSEANTENPLKLCIKIPQSKVSVKKRSLKNAPPLLQKDTTLRAMLSVKDGELSNPAVIEDEKSLPSISIGREISQSSVVAMEEESLQLNEVKNEKTLPSVTSRTLEKISVWQPFAKKKNRRKPRRERKKLLQAERMMKRDEEGTLPCAGIGDKKTLPSAGIGVKKTTISIEKEKVQSSAVVVKEEALLPVGAVKVKTLPCDIEDEAKLNADLFNEVLSLHSEQEEEVEEGGEEEEKEVKAGGEEVNAGGEEEVKTGRGVKGENVTLALSIKLLTKEKLNCKDGEKKRALDEALVKLQELLSSESSKSESNVQPKDVKVEKRLPVANKLPSITTPIPVPHTNPSFPPLPSDGQPPPPPSDVPPPPPSTTVAPTPQSAAPPLVLPPLVLPQLDLRTATRSPINFGSVMSLITSSPPRLNDSFTSSSPVCFDIKSEVDFNLTDEERAHQYHNIIKHPSLPITSIEVRHDVLPHTHPDGFICVEICRDARTEPSNSYFKFPHRHSDGMLCETHCRRLVVREKMKKEDAMSKLSKLAAPNEPVSIPWRLIPIDREETKSHISKTLRDPRLNSEPSYLQVMSSQQGNQQQMVFNVENQINLTNNATSYNNQSNNQYNQYQVPFVSSTVNMTIDPRHAPSTFQHTDPRLSTLHQQQQQQHVVPRLSNLRNTSTYYHPQPPPPPQRSNSPSLPRVSKQQSLSKNDDSSVDVATNNEVIWNSMTNDQNAGSREGTPTFDERVNYNYPPPVNNDLTFPPQPSVCSSEHLQRQPIAQYIPSSVNVPLYNAPPRVISPYDINQSNIRVKNESDMEISEPESDKETRSGVPLRKVISDRNLNNTVYCGGYTTPTRDEKDESFPVPHSYVVDPRVNEIDNPRSAYESTNNRDIYNSSRRKPYNATTATTNSKHVDPRLKDSANTNYQRRAGDPRLTDSALSEEALRQFVTDRDSHDAIPTAIRKILSSSLRPYAGHLTLDEQNRILTFSVGYFAALLEKLIKHGKKDAIFQYFQTMVQWSTKNAYESYQKQATAATMHMNDDPVSEMDSFSSENENKSTIVDLATNSTDDYNKHRNENKTKDFNDIDNIISHLRKTSRQTKLSNKTTAVLPEYHFAAAAVKQELASEEKYNPLRELSASLPRQKAKNSSLVSLSKALSLPPDDEHDVNFSRSSRKSFASQKRSFAQTTSENTENEDSYGSDENSRLKRQAFKERNYFQRWDSENVNSQDDDTDNDDVSGNRKNEPKARLRSIRDDFWDDGRYIPPRFEVDGEGDATSGVGGDRLPCNIRYDRCLTAIDENARGGGGGGRSFTDRLQNAYIIDDCDPFAPDPLNQATTRSTRGRREGISRYHNPDRSNSRGGGIFSSYRKTSDTDNDVDKFVGRKRKSGGKRVRFNLPPEATTTTASESENDSAKPTCHQLDSKNPARQHFKKNRHGENNRDDMKNFRENFEGTYSNNNDFENQENAEPRLNYEPKRSFRGRGRYKFSWL